ncbi:MAG: aminotransferase class I/II-fold pyridoxal phosphate-dependent enzyme [Magnetococcales bacterium]|nr:aminotransferase class I/II-fold pyridoxal phosphate-dependent enzyme [Magnetococcales bacterium]
MIPIAIPDTSGNESRYLQTCIETNFVSSVGPFVSRFEQQVAQASGNLKGVAMASGTAGLHTALVAMGVGPGDLVILPSLTFIASANAIRYCGADPWLFDVDRQRWNLDVDQLAHGLATQTERRGGDLIHGPTGRRIAAIMPVHTLGMPADMDAIVSIAKSYELPVIADGAAALGATDAGRPVGDLGADLTVFSFNGNKTVTCGGGGAVVGDDPALMDLVRHLSTTARTGIGYDHDRVGFNYRMTNIQAAIGCAQMERLEPFIQAKRQIRQRYDLAFSEVSGLAPFPDYPIESRNLTKQSRSGCWFSGVWMAEAGMDRISRVLEQLRQTDIDARPFWKPIHLQTPYNKAPKMTQTVSESLWFQVVVLPCSVSLSLEDQQRTIQAVMQAVSH